MVTARRAGHRSEVNVWAFPLSLLIAFPLLFVTGSGARQDEAVFFSTYGFLEGSSWVIPVRVKVQEPRGPNGVGFGTLLDRLGIGDVRERRNYMARFADFIADDKGRKRVRIRFTADPKREALSITDAAGRPLTTGPDGILDGFVRIGSDRVEEIRAAQGSTDGWLTFNPVTDDQTGLGRARLIEAVGLSVISDIDDTIKVTEVPAGKTVLARNTFCREFVPAMELVDRYSTLKGAPVHYVSGGPWQLYRTLAEFVRQNGFPEGSFHMRVIGGSALTASRSLEALGNFISEDGTFNHKVEQITRIMTRFPGRKFILIGDSGEQDPLVYTTIRSRFPAQVQEIIIRDVVNARENASDRLTGMTVIAAPTVSPRFPSKP